MTEYEFPWDGLCGGYGLPYDPRPALEALRNGSNMEGAWKELWDELHHQGDVGETSYASVPVLVDIHRTVRNLGWNIYALAACIEVERHRKSNPPLPIWLTEHYQSAWRDLVKAALDDLRAAMDPTPDPSGAQRVCAWARTTQARCIDHQS